MLVNVKPSRPQQISELKTTCNMVHKSNHRRLKTPKDGERCSLWRQTQLNLISISIFCPEYCLVRRLRLYWCVFGRLQPSLAVFSRLFGIYTDRCIPTPNNCNCTLAYGCMTQHTHLQAVASKYTVRRAHNNKLKTAILTSVTANYNNDSNHDISQIYR